MTEAIFRLRKRQLCMFNPIKELDSLILDNLQDFSKEVIKISEGLCDIQEVISIKNITSTDSECNMDIECIRGGLLEDDSYWDSLRVSIPLQSVIEFQQSKRQL